MNLACPLEYQYRASDFARIQSTQAHTIYVVGGLYGNLDALHALLRMQEDEKRSGVDVTLVFNGDHNWFNIDEDSFKQINQIVLEHCAIRGNVEAEVTSASAAGCGCNYPDYVNPQYVGYSNAIMAQLQLTARGFVGLCDGLNQLPLIRTIDLGGQKIGIVHGDAQNLAGWGFAAERLSPTGKTCSGDQPTAPLTARDLIDRYFRDSGVAAFASSHTCLAHAVDFKVDGQERVIMNNGAAGLPNFANQPFGLITRISLDPKLPNNSLYGGLFSGLRYDALPVYFDQQSWLTRFNRNWPEGSAAHTAYFDRVMRGPNFELHDAIGGRFSQTNH